QSISVSRPFFTWSSQAGAAQVAPVHTPLWQSYCDLQGAPTAHAGAQDPGAASLPPLPGECPSRPPPDPSDAAPPEPSAEEASDASAFPPSAVDSTPPSSGEIPGTSSVWSSRSSRGHATVTSGATTQARSDDNRRSPSIRICP